VNWTSRGNDDTEFRQWKEKTSVRDSTKPIINEGPAGRWRLHGELNATNTQGLNRLSRAN
ncbi:hypothetical protein L9F63_028172, partial [Diploptera punctata]